MLRYSRSTHYLAYAFTLSVVFSPLCPSANAATGVRLVGIRTIAQVGAQQILNAEPIEPVENPQLFRFRVRRSDEDFQMVRDFGPSGELVWTSLEEGTYEIEATLRDTVTGAASITTAWIHMQSRLSGADPAVNPTVHPLVMLYSAPPCDPSQQVWVTIWDTLGVEQQTTPSYPCRADRGVNFYLAGLRPETSYTARQTVGSSEFAVDGPALDFRTGPIPDVLRSRIPSQQVLQGAPSIPGVLLQAPLPPSVPAASDLAGNIVWYYPGFIILTRPEPGGKFFGFNRDARDPSTSFVRMIDLAGNTILETTAAAINMQLAAQGKRAISVLHHEARVLPDGNIAVLGTLERLLRDVQGEGEVNVIGDMIVVLNRNLEVVWTWDTFDHLDNRRRAVLNETCVVSGACDPWFLTPDANDWTHGNAVSPTPDGGLLYSTRHQDWLIKINYDSGQGDGAILWRLGQEGDFTIESSEQKPWFTHQHDGELHEDGLLTVFDNGNTRQDPEAETPVNSRAQVYQIDESARTAKLLVSMDIGAFAAAVGSSQRLPNGNFHFGAGWMPGYSTVSFELDPSGNIVFALKSASWEYRTYRMPNMYGPFANEW